uniref:P0 protein n=1 Tax=Stellaria aquatica mottle polerovirus A TaxID=3040039 RepID=A0A9Y2E790_9VIRU|nr:P0 protein [Stellaria aquatica mottle polerovirus A]
MLFLHYSGVLFPSRQTALCDYISYIHNLPALLTINKQFFLNDFHHEQTNVLFRSFLFLFPLFFINRGMVSSGEGTLFLPRLCHIPLLKWGLYCQFYPAIRKTGRGIEVRLLVPTSAATYKQQLLEFAIRDLGSWLSNPRHSVPNLFIYGLEDFKTIFGGMLTNVERRIELSDQIYVGKLNSEPVAVGASILDSIGVCTYSLHASGSYAILSGSDPIWDVLCDEVDIFQSFRHSMRGD